MHKTFALACLVAAAFAAPAVTNVDDFLATATDAAATPLEKALAQIQQLTAEKEALVKGMGAADLDHFLSGAKGRALREQEAVEIATDDPYGYYSTAPPAGDATTTAAPDTTAAGMEGGMVALIIIICIVALFAAFMVAFRCKEGRWPNICGLCPSDGGSGTAMQSAGGNQQT